LVQASACCFLVHDHWTKLLVVSDQNDLLTSQNQRDHAFWFRSLSAFIDEYSPEFEFPEPRIAGANTSTAYDIGIC
jgi:hypothetical protein